MSLRRDTSFLTATEENRQRGVSAAVSPQLQMGELLIECECAGF